MDSFYSNTKLPANGGGEMKADIRTKKKKIVKNIKKRRRRRSELCVNVYAF